MATPAPLLGPSRASGFTLMEMVLALGISALVLAAIGGVFFSGMKLRERTHASIEEAIPVYYALDILRRDLKNAIPPGGMIAGDFIVGAVDSGLAESLGIQFSTTTGRLKSTAPWGDVQEVVYELRSPEGRSAQGMNLMRTVSRNLLTSMTLDATEEVLLTNIQDLEFYCYDGYQWRTDWDTSMTDTNLPTAVRVRIRQAPNEYQTGTLEPMELLVPLSITMRPEPTAEETSEPATEQTQ